MDAEQEAARRCARRLVRLRARGHEKPARAAWQKCAWGAGMFFATGARSARTNRRPPRRGRRAPLGQRTMDRAAHHTFTTGSGRTQLGQVDLNPPTGTSSTSPLPGDHFRGSASTIFKDSEVAPGLTYPHESRGLPEN